MRFLLLFSFSILFSSATFSYPTYGNGILEILVESGVSIHAGFVVTYENKSHVTWRQLKPNTPELLIFEGFNVSQKVLNIFELSIRSELMNVTIHDNLTSSSVLFNPLSDQLYDFYHLPLPYIGFEMKIKCAKDWYGIGCQKHCSIKQEGWRCDKNGMPACVLGYCGWNCHQSGSECESYFANCHCKNGGKCYETAEHSTRCQCPLGYTARNRLKIVISSLKEPNVGPDVSQKTSRSSDPQTDNLVVREESIEMT
ncbi:hypothetical protein GCK72_015689 [Caenorhabditis remanei]|uniref:Uncharacterized protein n=1 Tax=Caenorhabditis remanei TaxID=31234 RepID=A0A6A5GUS0_CAERE|nr:hypothetical protein GCK72_015689 [Caenorhabditis remanei]KAF1759228.1 hypothetical protein GCK72_015689 [Caenorhabditis remanei]